MSRSISFKNISLIVYDFDGVMTNNKVLVDENGTESVIVNRADGLGISEIKKYGITQIIISTEKNPLVAQRAKKLNIPCIQDVDKKDKVLLAYCEKNKLKLKNIAFVGNDLNDLPAMKIVGIAICPADSAYEIKKISDIILKKNGGDGVVRELLDIVISSNTIL
tara:strand:+ start:550 stop:1041 length:492 start_codon:yes stop_codon:yes gene_type:complete